MAIDAEGAEFDLGVFEPDRGLVGEPDGIEVALLVQRDVCRFAAAWGSVKADCLVTLPGMRWRISLALK